jgi:adenylylsulfate kinase-like enzyme
MFETCSFCRKNPGRFEVLENALRCPLCGNAAPFKRVPLFFLSGASCSGKSTAASILFERQKEYMTMECDILWGEHFNTPEDDYALFRDTWLRMAGNYAQYGMSTLLCGCITPEQIEKRWRRELFSERHYIAIVLSDEEMK